MGDRFLVIISIALSQIDTNETSGDRDFGYPFKRPAVEVRENAGHSMTRRTMN
jgi:hypothetical protein